MGNEAKKTHSSHKELQCKQWVLKQARLIVHTRSYNATMGNEARKTHCSHNELQMQTMGNKARKTYSLHKELQCKQWIMKQGRLIVHTRSYNATMGNDVTPSNLRKK
ncbi:hypothetical protein KSS87_000697 [Heliosperma pusillum]|nr:hypothetical protein KSS87_000697 [Heliosperma pusillum]